MRAAIFSNDSIIDRLNRFFQSIISIRTGQKEDIGQNKKRDSPHFLGLLYFNKLFTKS